MKTPGIILAMTLAGMLISGIALGQEKPVIDDPVIPDPGNFVPYEKPPQLVKKVEPVYPDSARKLKVSGKVTVQFYVDKKGDVKKACALKATPKGLGFEDAAVKAVLQWKFTPALQCDCPVGVWIAQVIRFNLSDIECPPAEGINNDSLKK